MLCNHINKTVYESLPHDVISGVPVFSNPCDYIDNYDKIASDLLDGIQNKGKNPFIEESLWKDIEKPTEDAIRQFAKKADKILDVGVGLGRLLEKFPELERYGMDASLKMAVEARKKGIDTCCSMVEDIPYKKDFFDIVVCTDVLEHVLDLNLACSKILSVMKPGAYLILRVPYRENLSSYFSPACPYEYVHIRNFDEFSLKMLFRKIFKCEVIHTDFAGYRYDWERLKFPPTGNRHYSAIKCALLFFLAVRLPLIKPFYRNLLLKMFGKKMLSDILSVTVALDNRASFEDFMSRLRSHGEFQEKDILKAHFLPIEMSLIIRKPL